MNLRMRGLDVAVASEKKNESGGLDLSLEFLTSKIKGVIP